MTKKQLLQALTACFRVYNDVTINGKCGDVTINGSPEPAQLTKCDLRVTIERSELDTFNAEIRGDKLYLL